MAKTHDTSSEVEAEEGSVLVSGPAGVVYTMTPEAAAETSERLSKGAEEARDQRRNNADKAPATKLNR